MEIEYGYRKRPGTVEDVQGAVGKGWKEIIARLIVDLEGLGWNGVVLQVKEKFGGLRFYIGTGTDAIFDRINEAENESLRTCEDCGQPGRSRNTGWIKTLCDACCGKRGVDHEDEGPDV